MIELKEIGLYYPPVRPEVKAPWVFRNLSFSLPEKGFILIQGPSGSGKTTLLHVMGGLLPPVEGRILINNTDIYQMSLEERENYLHDLIAFLFQSQVLFSELSVEKNLQLPLLETSYSKKEIRIKIKKILQDLGLADYATMSVKALSKGERQRVALAAAILRETLILLADEPTSGINEELAMQVLEILKAESKQRLIVTVSHAEYFHKFADQIISL